MTEDLDRSLQTVRVGQKPYFEVNGDQLILRGTPINPDPRAYFAEHPPEITSYLCRLLLHGDTTPWRLRQYLTGEEDKRRHKILLNKHIVLKIIEELRARKLEYMFLIFHPKDRPDADTWRDVFLRDLLNANQVPFLTTREIVKGDSMQTHRNVSEYYIPGDGHPTARQNALVAKELKNYIYANIASESRDTRGLVAGHRQ